MLLFIVQCKKRSGQQLRLIITVDHTYINLCIHLLIFHSSHFYVIVSLFLTDKGGWGEGEASTILSIII